MKSGAHAGYQDPQPRQERGFLSGAWDRKDAPRPSSKEQGPPENRQRDKDRDRGPERD